ncbi:MULTISPECIES: helix-turn-helix domain-containing protein [Marinobacter]|jgi:transcriptional regulator with XRE-family HTH domain|uniref:Helix-turn-helix domain-containing protein n=1 Tax=Marinobacter shengliensis TaxID=1389223 RepID=A0ABV4W1M1_9GAMM|nr:MULTISPECIES: helix-turn-helix transcriptional regulator [Marinobacter]MDX5440783.1 helix-turn-helix transcriptional regulator [Alteromonadaceae bacterium]WBU40298.1 helix-turn-helix transcriptional regulator [Marinobacter alkaliphilus]MDX5334625.1 helix-turn-helix transcriptional regulator [Marinobacter sp.]MDX5385121.1 helix-turn-helix transcriptional regulator [Marinobacter sp.]MDX5470826.1 helix-turn-helix transcriptional regulator [Marinobacter sp.]
MAQTSAIVSELKRQLRAHGLTYQDVAQALALSEASVKRLFSDRQFSLKRLDQVCGLMGMEITDLVRKLAPEPRVEQLSEEQERELVSDLRLLLVAVCAMNRWQFGEILQNYQIEEPELIRYLARLDRMGLVELLPGNRIKLLVSHDFAWQPRGPIQRFFETEVQQDFLKCRFHQPGEMRLFVSGMLSPQSNESVQQKLKRLALEFRHCHEEDLALPLEQRFGVSLLMAMRPWEIDAFASLRRPEARKAYPGVTRN